MWPSEAKLATEWAAQRSARFTSGNTRFELPVTGGCALRVIAARMMTRLQFLRSLGQLGLAAAAAPMLVGCKADDDAPRTDAGSNPGSPDASMSGASDAGVDGPPPTPPTCDTVNALIGGNHGHTITVSADDVAAGVEKTYQIQGSSLHPHTVTVTANHFATLKTTGSVTVTSSLDDNHTHPVTVTCPS